jgi:hypothetical protein
MLYSLRGNLRRILLLTTGLLLLLLEDGGDWEGDLVIGTAVDMLRPFRKLRLSTQETARMREGRIDARRDTATVHSFNVGG